MKKQWFTQDIMHFMVMVWADIQAEYPEIFECIITITHIAEKALEDVNITELSEYFKTGIDSFFKG